MRKSIKVTGIALVLGVVFTLGTYTGASTDWKIEVTSDADRRIAAAGYHKKEELVNSDVATEIKLKLDPKIKQYEDEVAKLLEDYFQLKLQGILDSPEGVAIEEQMASTKQAIYDRYKQEIDAMFGE